MARTLGEGWVTISPDGTGFAAKAYADIKRALAGIRPEVTLRLKADAAGATAAVTDLKARMAALAGQLGEIPIRANDKQAEAVIAGLQAKLIALAKTVAALTLSADTKKVDAQIAALRAKLAGLVQKSSHLQIDADTKKALAKIAALEFQAQSLEKTLKGFDKILDLGGAIDDKRIAVTLTQLDAVEAELAVLNSHPVTIKLRTDAAAVNAAIVQVRAEIAALEAQAHDIRMNVDVAGLAAANAALLGLEGSAQRLAASSEKAMAAFLAEKEALALAEAATAKVTVAQNLLGIALGRTPPLITRGNNVMRVFGVTGGWLGGIFGVLGARITLFGGLLQGILPNWLTHVSVMHLAADVLVELIAVWGGAAIAAGAFGIAASDATEEVIKRMQALHTAADATNQSMYPLTGTLEKLHDAVRPQVYQVFGDALEVVKAHTGDFQKIVAQTGPVVDYLAGRMTAALVSGHTFDLFTQNAASSLLGLGNSFGNVFGAIGNVLNVVPDYAQKLLSFGVVVTRLLENFTSMIEPVLRWGLAIHGAFIYIGLATTLAVALYSKAIVPLAGALINAGARAVYFALALKQVAVNEGLAAAAGTLLSRISVVGWIALAVAGLTALVIWLNHSSDSTKNLADNIVALADAAPITQSLAANSRAAAAASLQLSAAQKQLAVDQAVVNGQTTQYVASGKNYIPTVLGARDAIAGQTIKVKDLQGALRTLQTQRDTEQSRLAPLIKAYGSTAAALGILNSAGITTAQLTKDQGQAWAIDSAQIQGTIDAYRAMTGVAGQLNNDLDVLGRTETDQYTATQKLNQAWSTFITDVTSTQGSFDTVAQGFEVLASHSGDLKLSLGKLKATFSDTAGTVALQGRLATATAAVASAQTALSRLQASGTATSTQLKGAQDRLLGAQDRLTVAQLNLSAAQSGGVAAIDALTPAGIALNQAFTDQIGNIDKLLSSWRTAGLANNLFVQGVRDSIAPLVKYAAGSQEATAQLIALAQEAGYHGPNSMKELTKWLGNTKNATSDLKKITNDATLQEALLTGAMQSQGDFIANQLIGDINTAILKYSGVAAAATAYGNAVAQFGKGSVQANTAQLVLVKGIVAAGQASNDTKDQIGAMIAKILGISTSDALGLIDQVGSNLFLTGQQAQKASSTIDRTFLQSLKLIGFSSPGINKDLQAFSNQILASGDGSDKTAGARKRLIADLVAAGVQADVARNLVNKLQGQIDALRGKIVPVGTNISGHGTITATQSITGGTTLKVGNLLFVARGGKVPGFGSGDIIPAMLTPGEVVIPRSMVAAGLVDHLRGKLPGFAGGGLVGVSNDLNSVTPFVDKMTSGFDTAASHAFAKAALDAMIKAIVASIASGGAGGGTFLGPGSGNYAADISTVLSSLGLPLTLVSNWLSQIQTESGGNLNAVNLTDSNAAAGHPSVGLLQLIPGTFATYAGPYRNTPPLVNFGGGPVSENPMAQIYAAIHYALARYGTGMGGVIGHGHGYAAGGLVGSTYDKGGILPPWKVGINTSGKAEMVTPATGGGSLHETNLLLRQMIHAVQENTRVTGAQGQAFAHGISAATSRGSIRGYYGG